MKVIVIVLSILCGQECSKAASNADVYYDYGIKHLDKNDESKAADYLKVAASLGHAKAQYLLGFMFQQGKGVERDEKEAIELFSKSAAQGNADAKEALALILKQQQAKLLANKPKTFIPHKNEVQWFAQGENGKLRGIRVGDFLDKSAPGVFRIGNGTNTPALGKLIDTFTDRKMCTFVVLPKTSITIEHVPNGTYQLIYSFGDELILGADKFWNPSGFSKMSNTFEFTSEEKREVDPKTLQYANMIHYKDHKVTLHGVEGGTAISTPINAGSFDQY